MAVSRFDHAYFTVPKTKHFFSEDRKSSIREPRLNGKTKKGVKKVTISADAKQDPDPDNSRRGIVVNYLVGNSYQTLTFFVTDKEAKYARVLEKASLNGKA